MNFLNTILDIVFPVNCLSCGKSGVSLCIKCISSSFPAERENANWIFSSYDYRNPLIKKSISLLKYKNKRKIASVFAEVIYGSISEELSDLSDFHNFKNPILIPIPLARKRMRERGFNQAELICAELIKIDKNNKTFSIENNVLTKPKDSEHQAKIRNRSERLKNIIGTFAIKNENLIKGKNIILIDDVTTTGATLAEAKKILKKSGAKKVIAFTLAH